MRRSWLLLALVFALVGCGPHDSTPEGAAKLFVRAVAMRDRPRMLELLAPEARAKLDKMAELATAQTSGRRRFSADELLAAGLDQPQYRLSRVQLVKVEGERAKVELLSAQAQERETLTMVRVKGRWRVVLPERALAQRALNAPASAPASRPAPPTSAPTSPP